jgi:energy-coupling factor transport system ATP-binding protein
MPVIFKGVNYSYLPTSILETHALRDVNIEIEDKSFTAIIGHTGSGKSTLAQCINALLLPSSGTIYVNDFVIESKTKIKHVKNLRQNVGLVFQFPEYQLFEETCYKDIAFGPKNFGKTDEEIKRLVDDAVALVGLDKELLERSPFELSGGQRRRVAIAGILAMKPSILILDEPTAGLDPQGAKEMMELFKNLHDHGTTIILISHDMDYVLNYCTKAIVMNDGRVVAYDEPINIFANEELTLKCGLELPTIITFAKKLIDRGLAIDICKVRNVATLANEIKRVKERGAI